MKQTAVEWLVDQLSYTTTDGNIISHHKNITHLFDQAKAMEKEQIMDAYEIAFSDAWDYARYNDEPKYASAEQYYNETFKSE